MREKVARPDGRIADVAARQHGVVAQAQLLAAGFSTSAISRRVGQGQLHRVHRGVYAVGHPGISLRSSWMAAVLAYGEGAAVSYRSAAELWGLLRPNGEPIDISVPGYAGKARRVGIRLHRRGTLEAEVLTRRHGIPVTKLAQTIADLRAAVPGWELRRAIRQADVLGLPHGEDARHDRTRSDLERDFLLICKRHRLPCPEVNVRVGPYLVDFLWRERCLAVETDGYGYHRGRQAFRDDRRRDLDLRGHGFEVVRLSEEQVADEPEQVAKILRKVLASARHRVVPDGGED
jgi:very-short-patch-repair endonuclease